MPEREWPPMLTVHGDIVTPEGVIPNGAVVVDDRGRIAEILPRSPSRPRADDIDAAGHLVLPGFIDMHVHGGGGADFMHGTWDAVDTVTRTHARFGTTGLLATTLTASREATDAAILAVEHRIHNGRYRDQAEILGIHLEGPYICLARKGAQPAAHVRLPDVEEFRHWLTLSANNIKQITLAPELGGAQELIQLARDSGVIVSVGHTDATARQTLDAIEWGAAQATHTFNAMRGLHHREPGTVGAALTQPAMVAEVIADGVHLDPLIVRLILAAKGPSGAVLITDAIEGAAMPDGEYALGGTPVTVKDGTASFADGTLAGSVLTMNRAFMNACRFADIAPTQASCYASANAARQLGILDQVGTLELGKQADLAILNPQTGDVAWTLIDGRVAYRR